MGTIYEMKQGFVPRVGGHAEHHWDRDNPEQVANAERSFKELKRKGFIFHTVDPRDGSEGAEVKTFHPSLERVIAVPPTGGG